MASVRVVGDQLTAQQGLERFCQFDADVVLFEVHLLEEGMVEQATDARIGVQVALIAVAGVAERGTEVVLDNFDVEQTGLLPNFDAGQLVGDAVLFVLHEVEREGSGIVGLQQFGPLIEQTLLLCVQLAGFTVGGFAAVRQFPSKAGFDLLAQFGGELNSLVFVFDQFLYPSDQ